MCASATSFVEHLLPVHELIIELIFFVNLSVKGRFGNLALFTCKEERAAR